VPWLHYPNKSVFSDRRNLLYNKCTSFRCDGRLFHSPGPAAANPLSLKMLFVHVKRMFEHRRQDGSHRLGTMCCPWNVTVHPRFYDDALYKSIDQAGCEWVAGLKSFDAHCCHMGTAIKHPVPDRVKPSFVIFDILHSDAQSWVSECPDVKNYKWQLNPVWHRMLYSCTPIWQQWSSKG